MPLPSTLVSMIAAGAAGAVIAATRKINKMIAKIVATLFATMLRFFVERSGVCGVVAYWPLDMRHAAAERPLFSLGLLEP